MRLTDMLLGPRRDDPRVVEYVEALDEHEQGAGGGARVRDAAKHLPAVVREQLDRERRG